MSKKILMNKELWENLSELKVPEEGMNLMQDRAGLDLKELYHTDRQAFFKEIGAKGGKARVKKGFAKFPKKKLQQAGSKGGSTKRNKYI